MARRLLYFAIETVLLLIVAAFVSALLYRNAPGQDVTLNAADYRLSAETKAARAAELNRSRRLLGTSVTYFLRLVSGDFGTSEINGLPVSHLLATRLPFTSRLVVTGASLSLLLAIGLAVFTQLSRSRLAELAFTSVSVTLLAIPSGVGVLLVVLFRLPLEVAMIAAVLPRLFGYCNQILASRANSEFFLAARAQGLSAWRLLLGHLLPASSHELLAMISMATVAAIAVSLPVEVLGNRTGIGELAWNAAMNRDLPVVLATTLMIVLAVRVSTLFSRLAGVAPGLHGAE